MVRSIEEVDVLEKGDVILYFFENVDYYTRCIFDRLFRIKKIIKKRPNTI
tara:strand:+ start:580 stop:729 length:150 start_codon:yes stop_codon:yes gene_type:complete